MISNTDLAILLCRFSKTLSNCTIVRLQLLEPVDLDGVTQKSVYSQSARSDASRRPSSWLRSSGINPPVYSALYDCTRTRPPLYDCTRTRPPLYDCTRTRPPLYDCVLQTCHILGGTQPPQKANCDF